MSNQIFLFLTIITFLLIETVFSQVSSPTWTWISGANFKDQNGTYGIQGIANSSNIPGARQNAVSWKDSNSNLWLFGGFAGNFAYLNDLWKFDGVNWIWISGSNLPNQNGTYGTKGIASSSNIPGARSYNPATWIDSSDNLWLFGGSGYTADNFGRSVIFKNTNKTYKINEGFLNDLWKFDGTNWTWISGSNLTFQNGNYGTKGIASSSNIPGSRSNAVSWKDLNDTLWLFGGYGYGYAAGNQGFLNDLWKYDGTYWTWISGSNTRDQNGTYGTQGIASSSNIPGSREGAVSWIDSSDNLWLFGGYGLDETGNLGYLNDLWKFDEMNWTWISGSNLRNQNGNYGTKGIASSSNIPGARYTALSWIDSSDNLWLFGGNGYAATGSAGLLNDLWKFDGMNWTWISGSNTRNQNGTYGTQGIASSLNIPGARFGAVSWTDSNDNFWLFGGNGNDVIATKGFFNDLWKFQFPPPITSGSLTYISLTSMPVTSVSLTSEQITSGSLTSMQVTTGSLTSNSLTASTSTSTTSTTGENADSGTSTIRTTSIILIIVGILALVV